METVKNLSGIAEEDIEELFNETDANDDGIVMRSEVLASLKGMDRRQKRLHSKYC